MEDPPAAVVLSGVFQTKRLALSFLWNTRRFTLCADGTFRRYDGEQLRHSAAITSTTSFAKVGDAEFTVTFLQPDLRYHIRAGSCAETDAWLSALADMKSKLPFSPASLLPVMKRFENASGVKQPTIGRVKAASVHDSCLELLLSGSAPDGDSDILADVAHLCIHVRFSLFFHLRRSLRHPLPTLARLRFPPKRLQRFLQGCVVTAAHRCVTAPASVFVDPRTKMILKNRIFARVMSGFVVREGMRLQAAAAARIVGKSGILPAARRGDVADLLSYLIAHANCVNERSNRQVTALHHAAENGHIQACQLLIDAKADVNATDHDKCTPLLDAACLPQLLQLLIDANADVNATSSKSYMHSGYTKLHKAAGCGSAPCCQLLIDAKADVNARNIREETALHHAAENGHIQACQLLIDAKADVNARRNTGNYTPLKCAIESNKRDVVALLRSVGAAE